VEIAPRVWWVSAMIPGDRFQCHAYLIEQGEQSVLIDPGSALTADAVVGNVERVVGLANVRWLVCSHADPDIIAAVPALLAAGLRSDAEVVTHWRDEALLRHLGWPLGFRRVDELGWQLRLEDRTVRFLFTPYVHFAGAFCSFDELTGTLFSSDLFGAFTDDEVLFAEADESLDGMRSFHEHYMPSREALVHSVDRLRSLPIERIAPQHGHVIPGAVVARVMEAAASWDCGLYLEAGDDPGLAFLFTAHRVVHELARVVLEEPIFAQVAKHVEAVAAAELGASRIELWARAGPDLLVFDRSDGFRGRRERPSAPVRALLDGGGPSGSVDARHLLVPLCAPECATVEGVAVVELDRPIAIGSREQRLLGDVAAIVTTALQREVTRRLLELDRAELYDRAVRDGLTGLYNRFYLDDALPRMLLERDRDGGTMSVLMIDVDHFKEVNDRHGHLVGDAVLRHVGAAIEHTCRDGDLAVRFGGEEFVVVLPSADDRAARSSAARLRAAVADTPDELPSITVSVGVARRRPMENRRDLLQRADNALYCAKAFGRDRVFVAP
jgi:diguanylate cyclase (GGDEF)-like protein